MRQTPETAKEREQALAIAEQVANLLGQLDALQPGSVRAGAGRISGPGLEIRDSGGQWIVRADR
ncbi:hypothetical protein ACGFMM_35530 [Streptomyces sp. NPDC048604]|uniref:hypothetical protein n=1 Tax=Streptomyces sp. NPDC048604 TaxID=3365578 RepID=UPI003721AACE